MLPTLPVLGVPERLRAGHSTVPQDEPGLRALDGLPAALGSRLPHHHLRGVAPAVGFLAGAEVSAPGACHCNIILGLIYFEGADLRPA